MSPTQSIRGRPRSRARQAQPGRRRRAVELVAGVLVFELFWLGLVVHVFVATAPAGHDAAVLRRLR